MGIEHRNAMADEIARGGRIGESPGHPNDPTLTPYGGIPGRVSIGWWLREAPDIRDPNAACRCKPLNCRNEIRGA